MQIDSETYRKQPNIEINSHSYKQLSQTYRDSHTEKEPDMQKVRYTDEKLDIPTDSIKTNSRKHKHTGRNT